MVKPHITIPGSQGGQREYSTNFSAEGELLSKVVCQNSVDCSDSSTGGKIADASRLVAKDCRLSSELRIPSKDVDASLASNVEVWIQKGHSVMALLSLNSGFLLTRFNLGCDADNGPGSGLLTLIAV
jgi:hypothetical protein